MATKEELHKWANEAMAGNDEAMTAFINATNNYLKGIVENQWLKSGQLSGRIAPSSIVQETYPQFLKFCREQSSEIRDPIGLLLETAFCRFLDRLKRIKTKKRDPKREKRGEEVVIGLMGREPPPDSLASKNEEVARLKTAIGKLSENDSELLFRRMYSDQTWDELAIELKVPKKTLQRRYKHLLNLLRAELGEKG